MAFEGNFMDRYKNATTGGWGVNAWDSAIRDGYSQFQIKTAIQRAHRAVGTPVGDRLRAERMQGVADLNDGMSQFQGGSGDIGYTGYMAAKASGYTPEQIMAGGQAKGMILREKAMAQYDMDMQNQANRDQHIEHIQKLTEMMQKPEPVGTSVDYKVGKGGAAELKPENTGSDKPKLSGTGRWRRQVFNDQVNIGQASNYAKQASNAGPLNTAQ